MPSYLAFAATSAALIGVSLAGIQVPLVVVNLSPHEANVDMSLDENCIKHDFNPVDLGHYYESWESNDLGNFGSEYGPLNSYLQQFKSVFAIPKLRNNLAPMSGNTVIPKHDPKERYSPYMVFETEMDGSGGCFGSHSRKSFNVTVNGNTKSFTLEDPPKSEWTLTMMAEPTNLEIVLGPGGTRGSGSETTPRHLDVSDLTRGFTGVYDDIFLDSRNACILGQNFFGAYDCDVVGVSLVIQPNGDIVAVPLPNIYRAWN